MSFNVGAVLKMWAFKPSEIDVSFSNNLCIAHALVPLDDREVPFIQQSLLAVAKFEDDDNGGLWELEISGSMTEISLTARQKINSILLRHCIIVIQNTIGDYFLFGNSSSPMIPAAVQRNQPQKISEATFYSFKLFGSSVSEPPLIYSFS